jgi:hypothetical protein
MTTLKPTQAAPYTGKKVYRTAFFFTWLFSMVGMAIVSLVIDKYYLEGDLYTTVPGGADNPPVLLFGCLVFLGLTYWILYTAIKRARTVGSSPLLCCLGLLIPFWQLVVVVWLMIRGEKKLDSAPQAKAPHSGVPVVRNSTLESPDALGGGG